MRSLIENDQIDKTLFGTSNGNDAFLAEHKDKQHVYNLQDQFDEIKKLHLPDDAKSKLPKRYSLEEFAENVVEFFADNALEHERVGETIDRIGLPAFLEALEIDPDPNMVNHPRTSCYVRTDDFDEEAEKWFERQAREAGLQVSAE